MSDWKPVDAAVRNAVEHEGNTTFMIEAGAGTGKTELMVYRVVAMIRSGAATVDQLVVITFTDDAAGEISSRTRQTLELLLAGTDAELESARLEPLTDDERGRVRAALDGIHRAHIQTIHAFASSLLRERPVEAGIDPAFVTLDQMQESAAFDEAFDAWINQVLDTAPPELALAMERGLGPRQIRSLAETLQAHRAVLPLSIPKATMPQVDDFVASLLYASAELQKLSAFVGKDDRGLEDISGIITFANQVARLAAGLGDDEVVEAKVVRNDQIFLDVHERVARNTLQLAKLLRQLLLDQLEEATHCSALSDPKLSSVPTAVPVRIDYLDKVVFDVLLLTQPLLLEPLLLCLNFGIALAVREKRGRDRGILAHLFDHRLYARPATVALLPSVAILIERQRSGCFFPLLFPLPLPALLRSGSQPFGLVRFPSLLLHILHCQQPCLEHIRLPRTHGKLFTQTCCQRCIVRLYLRLDCLVLGLLLLSLLGELRRASPSNISFNGVNAAVSHADDTLVFSHIVERESLIKIRI